MNQFVEGEVVTAATKERLRERKRNRRATATNEDGEITEYDSEKRRRRQVHFIRESVWSILGNV